MNEQEARDELRKVLDDLEASGYGSLRNRIDTNQAFETEAASGRAYQLEVTIVWDHKPDGAIRVLGSIDDGGLRAFFPLTESRLVEPP
jgi:hypothetical protein